MSDTIASLPPEARTRLHEALRKKGNSARLAPITRERAAGPYPLSFAQERLWFLDQWHPGSPLYNVCSAIRLPGPVSLTLLQTCLDEVVRRHESLRTTFTVINGEPRQQVAAQIELPIALVDLQSFWESEREAEAQRLAALESQRAFDLAIGPLMRVLLLRVAPTDHVLMVTLHHIITDGWSLTILFHELALLYDAYMSGRRSPLPELPIQYTDYALWQRRTLQGEELKRHLDWWMQHLAGGPSALALPSDRPRPALPSFRGGVHVFEIPEALTEELKRFSRREDTTLFMTVLAAFQVLLARYSGQRDVVVGVPIANRTRVELERLIGFFVNTLPLRLELIGNPSVREVLEQVRRNTLLAYAHQDLPFERLVQEIQPDRSLTHNPIFQVALVLQNAPGGGASAEPAVPPTGLASSRFDLSMALAERPRGMAGAIEYSSDLFDEDRVRRFAAHFKTLLESLTADAGRCVWDLPLLSAEERHQLLFGWSRSDSAQPHSSLHCAFEAHAESCPTQMALLGDGTEWTYGELNARSNRLARYLRQRGVGLEAPVAVCLQRSPQLIEAFLAVLKAGSVYVPLNPDYPGDRLRYMLEDSGCRLLLTEDLLERDRDEISRQADSNLYEMTFPGSLAYAIYTSGSTGKPKAVMAHHQGLAYLLAAQSATFPTTRPSRVLQLASASFDASIFEIALALGHGATLCIGTRHQLNAGPDLADFLRKWRITAAVIPPPLLALTPMEDLPELELLIVAGEACPPDLAARWAHSRRLFNAYGPTEAGIWSTIFERSASTPGLPIGRPVANTRCYVLNGRLAPTPVGVTGELYIAGPMLTRGYRNRPCLTAERFVPDPFDAEPGARMYRTGDLVRYRADKYLEFVGRADEQVKVRGLRIETAEIENAVRSLPSVMDAAVAAIGEGPSRYLAAYVVLHGGAVANEIELRQQLGASLPEYIIPATFVFLDVLPLTPGGKLDRQRLQQITQPDRVTAIFVAPRNDTEQQLASIWSRLLGVPRVGIHDSFFSLGGHSLLATRVLSSVRDAFSVELPLAVLFAHPTVAALAEAVECARVESPGATASAILKIPREQRRIKLAELRVEHAS